MARIPPVEKGRWYFAVRCRECGKPICLFLDERNGSDRDVFVGDGEISTACPRCHTDTKYAATEIQPCLAEEGTQSKTPPRVAPSKMPRQKIDKRYPGVKATFGPGFLEDRPAAAALIARCIALWTEVESALAVLLARMLQANTQPAIAMFLRIESGRIQEQILNAVAEVVLDDKDFELFRALISIKRSVESERNALAHGQFGGADQIRDGVAWLDPSDHTRHTVSVDLTGVTDEAMAWIRDRTYVYELGDLETIAQDAEELHGLIRSFSGYVWAKFESAPDRDAWRAQRYVELYNEPRIARALAQLREVRQERTPNT